MDEGRPYGAWAASGTLHAAILALVVLGFAAAPKFEDSDESIPVETVSSAQLNAIMDGEKRAEPAPPPRPAPEAAASPTPPTPPPPPPDLRASIEPTPTPPPHPEPAPKAEPLPKSAPPPKPLAEDAPEPPVRPKAEPERPRPPAEKPRPDLVAKVIEREKTEPEPKKPTRAYDAAAIAKLIGEAKPASAPAEPSAAAATPQGLPRHNAPKMSVSMAAALDAWLTDAYLNCWTPPPTMPEGDVYVAEIKVVFNVDGSLSARPVLLNPPTDPAWRAHADSAMRAVKKCDPLRVPPEYIPYFEQWRVETIHFDPRETQG